jgi:hypothetical protein
VFLKIVNSVRADALDALAVEEVEEMEERRRMVLSQLSEKQAAVKTDTETTCHMKKLTKGPGKFCVIS